MMKTSSTRTGYSTCAPTAGGVSGRWGGEMGNPFINEEDDEITFAPMKVVECPQCHHRQPVPFNLVDYGRFYREEKEFHRRTISAFEEWVVKMRGKVPEFDERCGLEEFEFKQLLRLLKLRFSEGR